MAVETILLATLVVPLLGSIGIVACGRKPDLREAVTLVTAAAVFGLVVKLVPHALAAAEATAVTGFPVRFVLLESMPGVRIAFQLEPLGMVYALVASSLWLLNSIYSIGYMRGNREKHQTRFYACFPLAIASAMGIAFADNPLTMFVFYETLTLSTYPLVTHKGTPDAVRSGRTYLTVLLFTSVCLQLFAVVWIHALEASGAVPSASFAPGGFLVAAVTGGALTSGALTAMFVLYVYGIGKAALMPAHRWLPAAMVAPTPVSAFLHAVAVVKAGVFCVLKVTVLGFGLAPLRDAGAGTWLVFAAGTTIVTASLIALFQDNLKRRLAYSTISQLSYVVLGAALLTPSSVAAATFYVAAHAVGKITLFFAAGSIYTASHKTLVSELDGIGRRMPITMTAFAIGTFSMIGLPPAAGFLGKWLLVGGAADAATLEPGLGGPEAFAFAALIASTFLNAGYFLPIVYRAFFRRPSDEGAGSAAHAEAGHGDAGHGDAGHGEAGHGEAPWPIVVALSATAIATLGLFVWPGPFLELAEAVRGLAAP